MTENIIDKPITAEIEDLIAGYLHLDDWYMHGDLPGNYRFLQMPSSDYNLLIENGIIYDKADADEYWKEVNDYVNENIDSYVDPTGFLTEYKRIMDWVFNGNHVFLRLGGTPEIGTVREYILELEDIQGLLTYADESFCRLY